MSTRIVQILTKQSNQPSSILPISATTGEGFINTADGKLFYKGFISGTGSTTYLPSLSNASFFEVGSHISQLKIDDAIVSYSGISGSGLVGKFLSGTTSGFVLSDISNILTADSYITGGTFSNGTRTLTLGLTGNKPSVSVSGFTDLYISAATFTNNNLVLTNSTGATITTVINNFSGLTVNGIFSAATVSGGTFFGNGSNLTGIQDTRITALTFTNNNISIVNSTGGTLSTLVNNLTGLTVNGALTSTSISATTISGVTFFGNGSNLTGFGSSVLTGGTFSGNSLVLTNSTGGTVTTNINNFTGLTVNGGLTANTVSATTLFGNGANLTGFGSSVLTGGTFSANTLTLTNSTGGTVTTNINNFSGLTVNGALSATTLFGNGANLTGFGSSVLASGSFTNNNLTLTNSTGGTVTTLINNFSGITVNGAISTTSISATTLSGGTFFGNGANLTGIGGSVLTGGTFSGNSLVLTNSTGGTVTTIINNFSGLTVNGSLLATTLFGNGANLTGFGSSVLASGTFSGNNLTLTNSTGGTVTTNINNFTGLTVNGAISTTSISATTLSGGTLFGNGSNLTGFGSSVLTGGTFSGNSLVLTNSTGGTVTTNINNFSGLTVNGAISTTSISATTLSATTLFGNGSNLTGFGSSVLTGGTFSGNNLTLTNSTGGTVTTNINNFTGLTVNGSLSATTLFGNGANLTGFGSSVLNSATFTNNNLTLTNSTGGTVTTNITNFTGITVNGAISTTNISATTLSGGTLFGNGANLTGFGSSVLTGGTFSGNNLTLTNSTGGTVTTNINNFTGLTVNGGLSATTISGVTFFGSGANLTGIGSSILTGGTFTNNNLVLTNSTGGTVTTNINNFTGLNVNGALSATTLFGNGSNLTGFGSSVLTGGTFSGNNLTLTNSTGGTVTTNINNFTGLTVNGALSSASVSATTISATTLFGNGANLTGFGSSVLNSATFTNNNLTLTNSTGGTVTTLINNFSGLTVNGGLTASTISGGTLFGNGSNLTGIQDTRITAQTFTNNNLVTTNSTGGTLTTLINNFSGLTVNGALFSTSVSATTISGGTLFGNGANLTGFGSSVLTGGTFTNNNLVLTNSTGGTFNTLLNSFSGLTVTGNETVTGTLNVSGATNIGGSLTALNLSTSATGAATIGTGGLIIGSGGSASIAGIGDLVVNGNITVFGSSFSAFTSQLYIEDNNITLNYSPTGDTFASALGSGFAIQDGLGIVGATGDTVFFNLSQTSAPVSVVDSYTKSFWESNLFNLMLGSSGATGSGYYVIKEGDVVQGGFY